MGSTNQVVSREILRQLLQLPKATRIADVKLTADSVVVVIEHDDLPNGSDLQPIAAPAFEVEASGTLRRNPMIFFFGKNE